jgi:hypothetical protein
MTSSDVTTPPLYPPKTNWDVRLFSFLPVELAVSGSSSFEHLPAKSPG